MILVAFGTILFINFIFAAQVTLVPNNNEQLIRQKYEDWKKIYKKPTHAKEDLYYTIFKDNLKYIEDHNVKFRKGLAHFELEMNKYGGMLFKNDRTEAKKGCLPNDHICPANRSSRRKRHQRPDLQLCDWTKKFAGLHSVRDQGKCGSCWAISAIGVLEGWLARNKKTLTGFSPRYLVDCVTSADGCEGGDPKKALDWVTSRKGVVKENDHPYHDEVMGEKNQCGKRPVFQLGQLEVKIAQNETALRNAVDENGPVSVSINSKLRTFKFYKSGVYDDSRCNMQDSALTHAMLLVGFGYDNKTKLHYWLVKNSWGIQWGERGYIRIARDKGNMCGIGCSGVYLTSGRSVLPKCTDGSSYSPNGNNSLNVPLVKGNFSATDQKSKTKGLGGSVSSTAGPSMHLDFKTTHWCLMVIIWLFSLPLLTFKKCL